MVPEWQFRAGEKRTIMVVIVQGSDPGRAPRWDRKREAHVWNYLACSDPWLGLLGRSCDADPSRLYRGSRSPHGERGAKAEWVGAGLRPKARPN